MTTEQIRERLLVLHKAEDELNKKMGAIDAQIKGLSKDKAKLAKQVSSNMRYRNILISKLKT